VKQARSIARAALALAVLLGSSRARADEPVDDEIAQLDAALALHPADVSLLVARAERLVLAERPEAALPDLLVAAALAPRDARVPAVRAEALLSLEQREAALTELDRAIDGGLASPRVLELRARLLARLGRPDEAIAAWDDALALTPDPDGYLERAALLVDQRRAADALESLREGLALTGAASLRLELIDRARQLGRWDDALVAIEPLVALEGAPHWRVVRGDLLTRAGRALEARRDYEAALAMLELRLTRRPTAASHTDHARALLGLGRIGEAAAACERALARGPSHPPALETRAEIRIARAAASTGTGGAR